jgi:hypothetical protein
VPAIVGLISVGRNLDSRSHGCLKGIRCACVTYFVRFVPALKLKITSDQVQLSTCSKAVKSTMTMFNFEMVSDPSPISLPFDDFTL